MNPLGPSRHEPTQHGRIPVLGVRGVGACVGVGVPVLGVAMSPPAHQPTSPPAHQSTSPPAHNCQYQLHVSYLFNFCQISQHKTCFFKRPILWLKDFHGISLIEFLLMDFALDLLFKDSSIMDFRSWIFVARLHVYVHMFFVDAGR